MPNLSQISAKSKVEKGSFAQAKPEIEAQDLIARQQALLDKINQSALNEADRKILIARVFDYSVADGLKLAEKNQYSDRDFLALMARPEFYLKHQGLADEIQKGTEAKLKTDSDKKAFQELKKSFAEYEAQLKAGQPSRNEEKLRTLQAKELMAELDAWYAQFLKTQTVSRESERDPRSSGERLGEEALAQIKMALEKNYYSRDVIETVIKELSLNHPELVEQGVKKVMTSDKVLKEKYKEKGVEAYLKNVNKGSEDKKTLGLAILEKNLSPKEIASIRYGSLLPETMVKKIASAYDITDQRKLNKSLYQPLDLTAKTRINRAEKELVKEIGASGGEIVWNEQAKKYEVSGEKKE